MLGLQALDVAAHEIERSADVVQCAASFLLPGFCCQAIQAARLILEQGDRAFYQQPHLREQIAGNVQICRRLGS